MAMTPEQQVKARRAMKTRIELMKLEADLIGTTRLLSFNQVAAITGYSRTRIHELAKLGKFPAGIKLGGGRRCWRSDDIRKLMQPA